MKIIDVRSKEEFDGGHLDNAENIDVMEMMNGKLPVCDFADEIMVYCASGGRSEFAKKLLESKGYTNVKNGGSYFDLV